MYDYTHYLYHLLVESVKTNYDRLNKLAEVGWYNDKLHGDNKDYNQFIDRGFSVDDKNVRVHNIFFKRYIFDNIDTYFDLFYENHIKGIKYFNDNYGDRLQINKDSIKLVSRLFNDDWKRNYGSFSKEKYFINNIAEYGFKNGILEGYIIFEMKYKPLFEELTGVRDVPFFFVKKDSQKLEKINQYTTNTNINIKLLKYLSENFTSSDKRFTDLTKYNQIYRFMNQDITHNIEHRAYKKIIKELFGFDYLNREIKGETQKHITQLESISNNYNNSKK